MFEIGWAELLVIGIVALIVIGPEDLPEMFRQLGRITGKLRQMGREFQRAMDQAAKDSGVKDVAKDIGSIASPKAMGLDAVKSAADKFEKWDPIKNATKPAAATRAATAGEAAADSADAALASRTATAMAAMTPAMTAPPGTTLPSAAPGPATQALYDKQSARKKVLEDSAAKLKAIDAGTAPAPSGRKPRAAKPKTAKSPAPEAVTPEAVVARARSTRAKKAVDPVENAVEKPRKPKGSKA